MDLRLLAGALLGSALTLAATSIAQAPRAGSSDCFAVQLDVLDIKRSLAPFDGLERKLDDIESNSASTALWAREVNTQLARIESDIQLQSSLKQLKR